MARSDALSNGLSTTLRWALVVPATFTAVFFVVPVASAIVTEFGWAAVTRVLGDRSVPGVAWFTVWQAVLSVAATLVVGIPATWAVHRWSFPGARTLRGVMTAPFLTPAVVMATGVLALFPADHGRGVHAIVWAHVAFNVAVVVRIVGPRWQLVDARLEDAAATLGASPWRVFVHVVAPQLRPAVVGAASMVFVFCATSFAVVSMVGGPSRRTIETEIFTRAVRLGDTGAAAVLGVAQVVLVVAFVAVASRLAGGPRVASEARAVSPLSTRPRSRWLPPFVGACTTGLVAAPMVAVIVRSLRTDGRWSFGAYRSLFDGSLARIGVDIPSTIASSAKFAAAACIVAIPLALILAVIAGREWFEHSPVRRAINGLTSMPIVVSSVILGFGIIVTFDTDPFAWRSEAWMIPIVHALVALPLAYRTIEPAVRAIAPSQRHAAAVLGASPWRVLAHVDLRTARPAIVRATGFVGAVSLGEFGATSFLSRHGSDTVPIVIAQLLGRPGTLTQQAGFALAGILVVATTAVASRA